MYIKTLTAFNRKSSNCCKIF